MDFYDRSGTAIAYCEDGEHIFDWGGRPSAFLYNDNIYSFSGKHMGWFLNGMVRDHSGNVALFTAEAQGGPAKPAKRAKPAKGAKNAKPAKGAKQAAPAKPAMSSSWSVKIWPALV